MKNLNGSQKKGKAYELILTIANRGFTDRIMEAARNAGAKGRNGYFSPPCWV